MTAVSASAAWIARNLLANGETPEHLDEDETQEYLDGIAEKWSTDYLVILGDTENSWFSTYCCDYCTSLLAGDRFNIHIYGKESTVV